METKTTLNVFERVLLLALLIGIYAVLGTLWLQPSPILAHGDDHYHYGYAEERHSHDSSDVHGLEFKIKRVADRDGEVLDDGVIFC